MRPSLKAIAILFAWLCLYAEVSATVYYVRTDGDNANAGTADTSVGAWRTIAYAASQAQPGDIVKCTGTFDERVDSVRSGTVTGGSTTNWITFDGQDLAVTEQFSISHDYIQIVNFDFHNYFTAASGNTTGYLMARTGSQSCIVSNNVFTPNDSGFSTTNVMRGVVMEPGLAPFSTDSPSGWLVISNEFNNFVGTYLIQASGGENRIHGNTATLLADADFMRVIGARNLWVSGNQTSDHRDTAMASYHGDVYQSFGLNGQEASDVLVENNIHIGGFSPGVMGETQLMNMDSPNGVIFNWTFRNNIFADMTAGATLNCPSFNFFNNLIVNCADEGHVFGFGGDELGSAINCVVKGNVFLDCGDARTSVGWYKDDGDPAIDANYNYVGKNGYAAVDTAATRSQFKFKEDNMVNGGDPLFVDYATLDFRLAEAASVLKGAAISFAGVTTDLLGTARPQNADYDIGPYEYVGDIEGGGGEPPASGPTAKVQLRGKVEFTGKVIFQ